LNVLGDFSHQEKWTTWVVVVALPLPGAYGEVAMLHFFLDGALRHFCALGQTCFLDCLAQCFSHWRFGQYRQTIERIDRKEVSPAFDVSMSTIRHGSRARRAHRFGERAGAV
jgi:hypothetical protein